MNPHAPTPSGQPDPQRPDKHDPSEKAPPDATAPPTESELDKALIETFPASDPVAVHSEATPTTPLPRRGRRFSFVWTLRWPWRDEPRR